MNVELQARKEIVDYEIQNIQNRRNSSRGEQNN